VNKIRVTADIDNDSPIALAIALIKGIIVCRKLPFKIRKTGKGYHIIWRGLNIDEQTMFKYRKLIGDDPNRIKLDMEAGKRLKQVLFCEKETHYYGYLFSKWVGSKEWITHCPICNRKIYKSVKIWSEDEKCILIYHENTKDICKIPLGKIYGKKL
jgi:hypothetical protein